MGELIRVMVATDERAAMPTAAAVRSVIDQRATEDVLHVAVLDSGLHAHTRRRLLRSWTAPRCAITFVPVDTAVFAGLPTISAVGNQLTAGVYARLLAGHALPGHWNRVIYLDSDTITRTSLRALWTTDLHGRPLGAVRDDYIPTIASPYGLPTWQQLGLDPGLPYLNSGVLIIDLVAWRCTNLGHRALQYLTEYRDSVRLFDQDALNAVTAGDWLELDTTWNVTGYWRKPERRTGTRAAILEDARIRHFAGHGKPWDPDPLDIPDGDLFFANLGQTDWAGQQAATPSKEHP
ncbi:glycosyltransferase family 8 protein [Actinoplanes sp. CA-054009]